MAQCKAKAKSTGERCRRRAVTGYRVCQVHGAGSPKQGRPGGRPVTNKARYTMHLPRRLVDTYERAARDPDLLALHDEIGLVTARLQEMLARVDTGESGRLWGAVREAHRAIQEARKINDARSFAAALADMGTLIDRGMGEYAAWGDIFALVEQRRRLVESERKRLTDMKQMITAEQALMLATRLAMIVKENVTDPNILRRIAAEFGEVVRLPDRRNAELGD